MARLYVLSGADVGRTLDFDSFATVGRIRACDLVLRDVSISRRHAHLQRGGEGWELIDDDSRNGITIAGERLKRARLIDGQEFLLGEVLLRFREAVEAPGATPAPALEPAPAPVRAAVPAAPASAPAPAEDSGLELEDADEIDLGAVPASLGQTRVARGVGSPAALDERARSGFKPAGEGLAEQRGRVLQYHRVAESNSLLNFEFEQLPLWQRALLLLAALALLAGMAWAAFFGAAFLRGKLGGGAVDVGGEVEPG